MAKSASDITYKLAQLGKVIKDPTMNGGVKVIKLAIGAAGVAGVALGVAGSSIFKRRKI